MASSILRVSVLADGRVLLDGRGVTLSDLAAAMGAGASEVWYYRENAAGEAPSAALEVMKLITERRLRVRLSTKPDFSDTVTPESASGVAGIFTGMRTHASQRKLVILRPDGRLLMLPALAKEGAPPQAAAAIEKLLPASEPRNVAVIADTGWSMQEKPSIAEAGRAVPFFGLLMGLVWVGHAVWMFDGGTAALLEAGCREAHLVIVDGGRLESLPEGWRGMVRGQVLVHDRGTNQLRKA